MRLLDFKKIVTEQRFKTLLYSVVFGLLIVFIFSGKSRIDLETIAVSPNEQYIACFETGNGHLIRCFHSDGSLAFDYNIPSDFSAGGHCTLWFEDDVLYVSFYRTDITVRFGLDGTILNLADGTSKENPAEFSSFSLSGNQYIFEGNEISVIYNKGSFLGYWFFGAERYLAITQQNEEKRIVYAWNAADGITHKTW